MRSTAYGCKNIITNRIHISAPDYQKDKILGILKVLVKEFVFLVGVLLGGTGQKLSVLHVIVLYPPRVNIGFRSALIKRE